MTLCDVCRAMFSGARTSPARSWLGSKPRSFSYPQSSYLWGGSHHTEKGSFLRSVDKGCYICFTIFRDCNQAQRGLANKFQIFYRVHSLSHPGDVDDACRYSLRFGIEIQQVDQAAFHEFFYDCQGDFQVLPYKDISPWINEHRPPAETSSPKCVALVKTWLKECDTSHSLCQHSQSSQRFYPKRLLDLGPDIDAGLCCLRSTDLDYLGDPYCTLSHCWGKGNFKHLTRANMAELERGIPTASLSKTFQDAIVVTRSLGVRYLWIDALCIIQDSLEDWESEAARMSEIYARSYCNIAALDAVNGEGCFAQRSVSMVQPCLVQNYGWSEHSEEIYAIVYDDFWNINLLKAPLHQRGWVLQERLLSPRTVHFGYEQIFWECHDHMACETYPRGIPVKFVDSRARSWRMFDSLSSGSRRELIPASNISSVEMSSPYDIWTQTVERFMECKLSQPSDKLVAIAGIAQKIAEITKERYLAGLWMNGELAIQLLWHVLSRRQADGRPSERSVYRAPSWSWACIEGTIVWAWPTPYERVLVAIIDAATENRPGEDAMCEVIAASLDVRGCLFDVELKIPRTRSDGAYDEDGTYNLLLDYEEIDEEGHVTELLFTIANPEIHLDTALKPAPLARVYCLPVCTNWSGKSGNSTLRIVGLILVPDTPIDGQYTRIGIFGLDQTDACHFCGLDPSDSGRLEEVLDSMPQQTIRII